MVIFPNYWFYFFIYFVTKEDHNAMLAYKLDHIYEVIIFVLDTIYIKMKTQWTDSKF